MECRRRMITSTGWESRRQCVLSSWGWPDSPAAWPSPHPAATPLWLSSASSPCCFVVCFLTCCLRPRRPCRLLSPLICLPACFCSSWLLRPSPLASFACHLLALSVCLRPSSHHFGVSHAQLASLLWLFVVLPDLCLVHLVPVSSASFRRSMLALLCFVMLPPVACFISAFLSIFSVLLLTSSPSWFVHYFLTPSPLLFISSCLLPHGHLSPPSALLQPVVPRPFWCWFAHYCHGRLHHLRMPPFHRCHIIFIISGGHCPGGSGL